MARLPIKITHNEHGFCLHIGDEARMWLYTRDDPDTARIANVTPTEPAKALVKDIARILTDAWKAR